MTTHDETADAMDYDATRGEPVAADDETIYAELAERAERGELSTLPGTLRRYPRRI